MFVKLDGKESRSREVTLQFVQLLQSKSIVPGDRLPPERTLAATLGVSRASLREGLRALTMLGIVEQRQGSGTYLASGLDGLPLEPYLLQLMLNRGKFTDFMELRRIVEPEVAALATERLDDVGRRLLDLAWERYEAVATVESPHDVRAEAEAGRHFHQVLAQLTGNRSLASLLESLGELMESTGEAILQHPDVSSFAAHRALYEAVRAGDAPLARSIMIGHLAEVHKELEAPAEGV